MNTPTLPDEIINKILMMREPNPICIIMRNYYTETDEIRNYIQNMEAETLDELEEFFETYIPIE